jgi:transposase
MNRPEVFNSLNTLGKKEIIQAIREAHKNPAIKTIILTGTGKAFCAGQDLSDKRVLPHTPEFNMGQVLEEEWNPLIETITSSEKLTIAVINGTEAKSIVEVLNKISETKRNTVREVSLDMARNMELAVKTSFANATRVTDRFHVSKLVIDALQHIRVKFRWEAIEKENEDIKEAKNKGVKYYPVVLENGDTLKELLARSRYLLYKTPSDWTYSQERRARLIFKYYPLLEKAYHLSLEFRAIYKSVLKSKAIERLKEWSIKVKQSGINEFNTAANSINYHWDNILNFFDNRSTNASAESFNAKIKAFRSQFRGVRRIDFFLFRLSNLYA